MDPLPRRRKSTGTRTALCVFSVKRRVFASSRRIRILHHSERHGFRKKEILKLDLPKVVALSLSPLENWLVTIVPFKQVPNLQIWNLKTGELHHSFTQCSYSRDVYLLLTHLHRCGRISNGTPRKIMRSITSATKSFFPFPIT